MILHTEVIGEGEPLVFLHTGLQTGMTDFNNQREYFKESYKLILPDLRGHGKSEANSITKEFFEVSAQDLEDTLMHIGAASVHIVGCSLGGLVGLYFAKRFPHRVKSLTLSGIMAEKPENWLEQHRLEVENQRQMLENESVVSYFDGLHQSDWKQFLVFAQDEEWYPFEITKDLTGIQSPILYMVGEGNESECRSALLYQSMHENIHVAIIPFAAHLVHEEQAGIYTEVLREFLGKVDMPDKTII